MGHSAVVRFVLPILPVLTNSRVMQIGETTPDFEREAHDGTRVKLSALRGKRVVMYFYPRDFTSVCTQETCGFRDLLAEVGGDDTVILGISSDSLDTHRRFASEYKVKFPLLADEDHALAKLYGAYGGLRSLFGVAKRVTYVIGRDGRLVSEIASELSASKHIEGVRAALAKA
jgi:thioredoxin-dependent peroxiredoxin